MTPAEFKSLRRAMDLSQRELADKLEFAPDNGHRTVRRIETGEYTITGPVKLAMFYLSVVHEDNPEIKEILETIEDRYWNEQAELRKDEPLITEEELRHKVGLDTD